MVLKNLLGLASKAAILKALFLATLYKFNKITGLNCIINDFQKELSINQLCVHSERIFRLKSDIECAFLNFSLDFTIYRRSFSK